MVVSLRSTTALAALAAACGQSAAPGPEPPRAERAPVSADVRASDLREQSIAELQQRMAVGSLSSHDLVGYYLQRIARIDQSGPRLRAVLEVNPAASSIAQALDRERAHKGMRGPLHGIPILLKDNIATADAMHTTAGSKALVGLEPRRDSTVAARLRTAGVVILGKANMSEWANFRTTRSSSGWSGRGGQTRNPYDPTRSPCGSSSGSAVAPAANLVVAAIGTETNGSIICPSSMNGVVGIKPTVGLVSRAGVIPLADSLDTPGPIARTVADAALVLGAIAGPDPRDPATRRAPANIDYSRSLDPDALRGARIGVARSHLGPDRRVHQVFQAATETMTEAGATLVDITLPRYSQVAEAALLVMLYEFKAGLGAYLAELDGNGPRTLEDIIAFNRDNPTPPFGQDLLIRAERMGPLSDEAYLQARKQVRTTFRVAIERAMNEHRLDAIIGPSGGPAWAIDPINGDHFEVGSSTPAAMAGYPNITVPAGFVHGLPVGVSFFGEAWSEPKLIGLAYAFEQATGHRRPPAAPPLGD